MRGRIQRALSGFYYVKCADGQLYTCKARGKFRREGISPLVGDDVEFCEVPGGEGRIDEILPRRNSFDRPSVANIDQMVIVCSQAIPKTDPYLVDRMTAIAALKGCDVLICINKCDLDPADALREYYENAGFRTVSVSAETGEGIEALRAHASSIGSFKNAQPLDTMTCSAPSSTAISTTFLKYASVRARDSSPRAAIFHGLGLFCSGQMPTIRTPYRCESSLTCSSES